MQICVKRTQPLDYHNQRAYSPETASGARNQQMLDVLVTYSATTSNSTSTDTSRWSLTTAV